MDISNAQTEPFFLFHRFHEASNRTVKSIAASIQFTKRTVGEGEIAKRHFNILIEATGEPWGKLNHYDPRKELDLAYRFLPEMGIVRVDSAFDCFLTSIEGEIYRWADFSKRDLPVATAAPEKAESIEQLRVVKLCDRNGWAWRDIKTPLEVYRLFHAVRNCVAHRDGGISASALECFGSPAFLDAWKAIGARRTSLPMAMPELVGDRIILRPRDVVFFSAVCHEIASFISVRLRKNFGVQGVLHMAAYHTLLSEAPVNWGYAHRSPEAVVNVALMNRMRVTKVTSAETIAALKRLDLWKKCLARHSEIQKLRAAR